MTSAASNRRLLSCSAIATVACLLLTVGNSSESLGAHVCVIGAGISGSTAAYFLSRLSSTLITVFEKQPRVGGRMEVLRLPNTPPIEAGASIIAEENKLMSYFVETLNLTRGTKSFGTMGLWNGTSFVYRSRPSKAKTLYSIIRRYGTSVYATKKHVRSLLDKYKKLYPKDGVDGTWTPHPNVSSLLHQTGDLFNLTQVSFASEAEKFFGRLYIEEMVAAITRVNYGQDVHEMNGMSGAVALAGSGQDLWAVKDGNYQVVEGLLKKSGAQVHLEVDIERVDIENNHYTLSSNDRRWECDAVVLAAPLELMSIELPHRIAKRVHKGRLFQLTVTTFVRGNLNEATFGPDPPKSILSTNLVNDSFTSVGLADVSSDSENPIFKVFSRMNLSDHHLERIFEKGCEVLAVYPWMAYPKFSPPEKFTSFDLDEDGVFIYTSPLESAGSAMEMSAVSGANAAALVREKMGLKVEEAQNMEAKEEL
ncbi:Prenylcysteine lyase [Gracilaria domingensis]|nr:Prenylcysteine lyase [Gracilaria domingensis]